MKKRYLSIELQALSIGVTRQSKKRVWLETKMTVKYSTGETDIKRFDTGKEAEDAAREIIRSSLDVGK